MAGVTNLSPGRPYDLRATTVEGKAEETDVSFPGVETTDTVAFVLSVKNGKTTDRTAEAAITAPGKVQFSADTTGERLHIVVYTPH